MIEHTKNDGGSADYYELPQGAEELQDLIEHKGMNFATGNIFKAAYRLGAENSLSDRGRDLRKIIWFADRELQRTANPFRSDDPDTAPDHLEFCEETNRGYTPTPPAREPLDLRLPSYALPCTAKDARAKLEEESNEWCETADGSMDELIEAWDCVQAMQTCQERGAMNLPGTTPCHAPDALREWFDEGRPVMQARRIMLIKNAARQKYSPEDCARILADV